MKSKAGISSSSFPRRSPSSLLAVAVFLCSVCLHSWSTTGTSTLGSTCSSSVGVGVAAYSGAAATAAFVGPRGYQQQERQPELLRSSSPFRNSASTACTYRRTAAGERNLVLFASNHNNDDSDSDSDTMALNKARTDIRNFLTQRAIQSFLFLLTTCRDEATVHWMEVRLLRLFLSTCYL